MSAFTRKLLLNFLGGLAAGLVLAGFGWLIEIGYVSMPWWLFLTLTGILLGTAIFGLVRARNIVPAHNVLVMLSAFERHTYFAEVLRYIATCLEDLSTKKGWRLQTVLKIPRSEYDPHKQKLYLDDALVKRHEYVGALIVPVEPEAARKDLVNFVHRFDRPVVFFDTSPCLQERDYTLRSSFVGIDNRKGGALAAKAIAYEFRRLKKLNPRILVIPAGFHQEREEGFRENLSKELAGAQIHEGDYCNFNRGQARRYAARALRSAAENRQPYDGAFCTGDEMALGLLDEIALIQFDSAPSKNRGFSEDLVVIGYDGINEARMLIDRKDSFLKNTVVQDSRKLGEEVVLELESLLKNPRESSSSAHKYFEPSLYRTIPPSREEYYAMARAGNFGPEGWLEFVGGDIFLKRPPSHRHAMCLTLLVDALSPLSAKGRAFLAPYNPIHMNDDFSEPQPDLAVLGRDWNRSKNGRGTHPRPEDVLLLVEIADSGDFDRRNKVPLYAQNSIPEVWLVDLREDLLEVYRDPSEGIYRDQRQFSPCEPIAPQQFPDLEVPVASIIPEART